MVLDVAELPCACFELELSPFPQSRAMHPRLQVKAPLNETDEERMIRIQMEALAAEEQGRMEQVRAVCSANNNNTAENRRHATNRVPALGVAAITQQAHPPRRCMHTCSPGMGFAHIRT